MKSADKIFSMPGMNQEQFYKNAELLIDRATTANEKLLCQLERDGGKCPKCEMAFQIRHCNKMGSDYYYYVPYCSCFDDKLVKLSQLDRWMLKSNIPLKYWKQEFDNIRHDLLNIETSNAFNYVRDYCENRRYEANELPAGIFLHGAVGSGKTLSAVLIGKYFLRKKRKVTFFDMVKFYRSIIDKTQDRFYDRAKYADVIILDDLTKEVPRSEWGQARIHELFDILDKNKKSVIVTDEQPPGKLKDLFLSSVVSRLAGLTGNHIVEFRGADFRKKERGL